MGRDHRDDGSAFEGLWTVLFVLCGIFAVAALWCM